MTTITPTNATPSKEAAPLSPRPRNPFHGEHRPSLQRIATKPKHLPNRLLFHALQKWGKTSFAAQAPNPIVLMTRGEDGLLTLMRTGQLADTPHFEDPAHCWTDILAAIDDLIVLDHPHKTFILDTINGAERLCHEHICEKEMHGDWKDFDAYGRGPKIAVKEFTTLLDRLDRLREAKQMSIILLCHSQVKTFKNPEGPDYDRWETVLAKESQAFLDRWADMILFGTFQTQTEKLQKYKSDAETKAKAKDGQTRVIKTERHAAYDAGNRHGLPHEIDCGDSPQEAWANFLTAL